LKFKALDASRVAVNLLYTAVKADGSLPTDCPGADGCVPTDCPAADGSLPTDCPGADGSLPLTAVHFIYTPVNGLDTPVKDVYTTVNRIDIASHRIKKRKCGRDVKGNLGL